MLPVLFRPKNQVVREIIETIKKGIGRFPL